MTSLNVTQSVEYDDRIIRYEYHSHKPYASTTFNKNDEIRIVIQHQDALTLPSKSYLYLDCTFKKGDGNAVTTSKLTRNALAFLFQEMRYELNGIEIDRTRNVGLTSTLKTYVSVSPSDSNTLENAGWFIDIPDGDAGPYNRFTACIPLKMLMGYFEDMQRIIMNAKQELILVRSASDTNSFTQTAAENVQIDVNGIVWKMPHITVSDEERLKLLKVLNAGTYLPLNYRSWELFEYPVLPKAATHTWAIKTSVQLEAPRFIILAFQTQRRGSTIKDSTEFDHCKLTNARVYLNSEYYPYENLHLQWDDNVYSQAFDMYARFRASYYEGAENEGCLLNPRDFKKMAPIIVIDCSKQNEITKSGPVDVRIEFESTSNFPDNTAAYALVLHDRVVNYCPLTGVVQRVV